MGLTSVYFTDACAHATCVQKHASLVRICGSYLWPASLPKEPMVRRELEGFIHIGSGFFCTSVLTSGSISEGDGVSFAPAMAQRLRGCCFQRRSESLFLLLVSEQAGSFTDRRCRRKPHLPVSLVVCRSGGGAPASLPHHGGRQTHRDGASVRRAAHSSIPDWEIVDASLRFARRHDYTSTSRPTGFTMRLYNRG